MKKIFLLLLCFPLFCIAQNINGIVTSKINNTPIEDVNVFALESKKGTLTNKNGEFGLKLSLEHNDNDILEFSHVGFTTVKFSFEELKKLNFKISLSESVENLSGLVVAANHQLKLKDKLNFKKLAPLKYGIFSFGSVLKDDKIYVSGGDATYSVNAWDKIRMERPDFTMADYMRELTFQSNGKFYKDKLLIYNIKTDTWETSELKFSKRAYQNLNYYDNKIYVLGGKKCSPNGVFEYLDGQIEVFDTKKQTLTIDKTNPHQAVNFASFTYKDNIIVMGGSTKATEEGKKDFSNKVHLYNITSGYWYELAAMPTAKETSGVLINNKIYLIGGNNGNPLSEIETFDLDTGKWKTEGKLPAELEKPAITYSDNTIYFFEDKKLYVYDTKSKILKEYIVELGLKDSALHYADNTLYIIGGYVENYYSKSPSANVYSISVTEFETTKPDKIRVLSSDMSLAKAD